MIFRNRGNGPRQSTDTPSMKRTIVGLASAAVLAGGLGATSFGLAAGTAEAEPGFAPTYHWCPGDNWHPEWGGNWDGGTCHDDHHRDIDAGDHSRDFWGGGYQDRQPQWQPPQPDWGPPQWQPPQPEWPLPPPPGGLGTPPFCIPFVNCPPS